MSARRRPPRPVVRAAARRVAVALVAAALSATVAPRAARAQASSSAPAAMAISPDSARAEIRHVLFRLFEAMRSRDTATMRLLFDPTAVMQGPRGMQREVLDGWLRGVAAAPDTVVLDERLGEPEIQVDGPLASVWVRYWFYAGSRFSHCGYDAFLLTRHPLGWRILSVADTRRKDGCGAAPPPPPR